MKNTLRILGIKLSIVSHEQVFEKISKYLKSKKQHYIVTPNPEIILKAQKNEHYFHALNAASLSLPDAMGIKLSAWFSFVNLKRITGADLSLELLSYAEENKIKVGIINWQGGLSSAEEIKNALKKKYPKLQFQALDAHREWKLGDYELINIFEPEILFVTFGNPYQELFLYDYLPRLPYVKLGLAVGSAFDYLTGKVKRAPKMMRVLGFEWLWRIFVRPKGKKAWKQSLRVKRIFDAFVVFPFAFLRYKFVRPFFYRPNIACLLYKKTEEGTEIFVLKRSDEKDHWQIPQGGLDGESLRTAAIRELHEEIGSNSFRVHKTFKNIHRYKFPEHARKENLFGYKGQKQSLAIAEFTGHDGEIKIAPYNHEDWKWVKLEELQYVVHECRQEGTGKFLKKFKNYLNI